MIGPGAAMLRGERAGPVVWSCIIGVTCLMLVLLEHMLWLVLPFIFGTVTYYMLLGVVMVVGETLGVLMTSPRLRARHRYAKALRERQASRDLRV